MPVIDCRSDLVARPTEAMIEAMAAALRAPGSFGLREAPEQRALEKWAATCLAKEDALLFPTCTMANEAAIIAQTRPGDTLLAEESSHVLTSEAAGPAALAGVLVRAFPGRSGRMDLADLERAIASPTDELRPRASLIVLENTHNRSGGACLSLAYHHAVAEIARAKAVPIHLDGARLFNAAVALRCAPEELARQVTTVAVSLNKGLCAPLGAILAGPARVIDEAARIRQRLGGGIRPAGFVAAAGLVALKTMTACLGEDHAKAAHAAAALAPIAGLTVTVPDPITNIVLVTMDEQLGPVEQLLRGLAGRGVLALPFGPRTIRLVFHRDVDSAAVPKLVNAFADVATSAVQGRA